MRKSSPTRPYIEVSTTVRVRFQEVDPMRIVWHGHYLSYFEDARRAFGERYGLDYADMLRHEVHAPLVHISVDFLAPALDNDMLEVTARLLKSDTAKLEFQYVVRRVADGKLLARGESIQAFTRTDGTLLLKPPALLLDYYRQWEGVWK